MDINKVNLKSEFASITEFWRLNKIGNFNQHALKTIKMKGEYQMHKHDDGDKLFLVVEGTLFIEFPDKRCLEINEGEFVIIPKNTEQKPFSHDGVSLLIIELES